MELHNVTLEACSDCADLVVVIDVIRAFTTAAYAFGGGAKEILLVSGVDEALDLKQQLPQALTMGELGGRCPAGFDFSNSPAEVAGADLRGRTLIQRTSAGTQGAVRSKQAQTLLAGSFCCAAATARYVKESSAESVTCVITGIHSGADGDEDIAFADYLGALLEGRTPDFQEYARRVRNSYWGRHFGRPDFPHFPAVDLDFCVQLDRFDFAMTIARRNGQLVLEARGR